MNEKKKWSSESVAVVCRIRLCLPLCNRTCERLTVPAAVLHIVWISMSAAARASRGFLSPNALASMNRFKTYSGLY